MLYQADVVTMVGKDNGSLCEEARRFFQWFRDQGCRVRIQMKAYGEDRVRLHFALRRGLYCHSAVYSYQQLGDVFRHQLCVFLAEHILKVWEPFLLDRLVKTTRLPEAEQAGLREKSLRLLHYGTDHARRPEYVHYEQSCRLTAALEACPALGRGCFFLEGFLRFRMKTYMRELAGVVKLVLRCRRRLQAYEAYMGLLRQYMAENTSLTETLHVQFYPGGGFCLWEDDGTCLCDRMSLPDEEAEKDLLLDTVVAAAPRRVIVHVGRVFLPHPMVKVLKDLFRMRLAFCSGCVICRGQEAAPRALPEDDP